MCVFKSLSKYFQFTSLSLFHGESFKAKISKLFETCRSKNISDVSGDPFFFPENRHHRQLIALFSPNPHSLSKPKPKPNLKPKITDKTASVAADTHFLQPHKPTKQKPRHRKPKKTECISSTTDNYYYDWRSSDDEDDINDETTLFSFQSESSCSFHKNRACRKFVKRSRRTRRCGINNRKDCNETTLEKKLVKDSFAVAKKSSNPHEDFRVSMLEMIMEKQIFGAEELTDLFECFISLNSDEHHRVIFEVFSEILEALFSASD